MKKSTKKSEIFLLRILILIFAISFAQMKLLSNISSSGLPISLKQDVGSTISLKYKADDRFDKSDDLFVFVYSYTSNSTSPIAINFTLTQTKEKSAKILNNSYSVDFNLPEETVYAYYKISNSNLDIVDDNFGNYWEIIFQKDGKILKNTNLKRGISYLGSSPNNCLRNINLKEAYNSFNSEVKLYPTNYEAKIALTSIEFDSKKITNDEFKSQLKNIIDVMTKPTTEGELRAYTRVLNILDRKKDAESIENEYVKTNPNSKIAEEKLVAKLTNAPTIKEFNDFALEYFKTFRDADSYETILQAYANSYVQMGKVDELIKTLEENESISKELKIFIASEIFNRKNPKETDLAKAENIYKTLFSNFENLDIINVFNRKPSFLNELEWANNLNLSKANLLEVGSDLYFKINQFEKSMKLHNKSLEYYKENLNTAIIRKGLKLYNHSLNSKKDSTFIITNEFTKEINIKINDLYSKSILSSIANDSLIMEYKQFLINSKTTILSTNITMNNINLYIDSLKQIATNKRLNSLKYRKYEGAEIYGSIKKLNGTYVDLSDLKGKTLILNFISSWCGPCQLIYPSLEKIYLENKSIDNKSVENKDSNKLEILTIDIWEQSQDREEVLAEMLKKIPVALPFYIDETDLLPTRYGVTGLPTFIFVDKNGKIQFIERGFSNEFEFLRDTKDKIKLLN